MGFKCVDVYERSSQNPDEKPEFFGVGRCKPLSFNQSRIVEDEAAICTKSRPDILFPSSVKDHCKTWTCVEGEWIASTKTCEKSKEDCIREGKGYFLPKNECCGKCVTEDHSNGQQPGANPTLDERPIGDCGLEPPKSTLRDPCAKLVCEDGRWQLFNIPCTVTREDCIAKNMVLALSGEPDECCGKCVVLKDYGISINDHLSKYDDYGGMGIGDDFGSISNDKNSGKNSNSNDNKFNKKDEYSADELLKIMFGIMIMAMVFCLIASPIACFIYKRQKRSAYQTYARGFEGVVGSKFVTKSTLQGL